jgi:hypothetical protein
MTKFKFVGVIVVDATIHAEDVDAAHERMESILSRCHVRRYWDPNTGDEVSLSQEALPEGDWVEGE